MYSPHSPESKPPVISASESEDEQRAPIIETSDTELQWLRSPTKSIKRRFKGRRLTTRDTKRVRTTTHGGSVGGQSTTQPELNVPEGREEDLGHGVDSIRHRHDSNGDNMDGCFDIAEELSANEESFESFVRMIDAGCLVYERVGRYTYVVQGWDGKKRESEEYWYHLEAWLVGDSLQLTCLCPDGKKAKPCIHQDFYVEFRETHFKPREHLWYRVVMFWHESVGWDDNRALVRFSVEGLSGGLAARAVVSYEGLGNGWGKWKCSKDRKDCIHIFRAKKFLGEVIGSNLTGNCGDVPNNEVDAEGPKSMENDAVEESAISHLPILPPPWAVLPSDCALYKRPDPGRDLPTTFNLTPERSGSACSHRAPYDPIQPVIVWECTIFTLTERKVARIELQPCPICPKRHHCYIGPETRDLGVFNYNNGMLFTHELMDEYTSRMASSETPFAAFVQSISRVYVGRGSTFIGDDLFRGAWFAYVSLQLLERDMTCPKCGDMPETVIWDGVTLAFSKKHLQNSLKPPTIIEPEAVTRSRRYPGGTLWFQLSKEDQPFRKSFLAWLNGGKTRSQAGLVDAEEYAEAVQENDGERNDPSSDRQNKAEDDLKKIVERLENLVPPMAKLLLRVFGPNSQVDRQLLKRYIVLFQQLAADESLMQMVNENSLQKLGMFVKAPSLQAATTLVDIPALLLVIEGEFHTHRRIPLELYELCVWMYGRGCQVLDHLKRGSLDPLPEDHRDSNDDWKKSSTNSTAAKLPIFDG
ncbi:hypothetical protein VNI00_017171 [Paramarasmius palmivorus]|uniref:HMG domain-containing protein n=1 Tax=Paramarasmius palmivorus TaxID=297713 RepID=A0AAW0B9P4_9AGAR